MYPILFKVHSITIYSFGLLVILGMIVGVLVLWFLSKKLELDLPSGKFFDYVIYVLLAGMIGSRLFYVIFHMSYFKNYLSQIVTAWTSGLSFYGGLIFGAITAILLLRNNKDRLKWLDIAFISTMFGLAVGMIGTFLNGSYYGKSTHLPWAVTFTKLDSFAVAVLNQPVHPVQIYESLVALVIGLILLFIVLKKMKGIPDGFVFLVGLFLYSAWRIIADYLFLGRPEVIDRIRIDVLISGLLIVGSVATLIYLIKKIINNKQIHG
jgi:phosphatidylglycerol:prolipoprotein diacylglycerol transferase